MAEKKDGRFRGDVWFREKVHKRVLDSITEQNIQFAQDHKDDTDRQLLDILRRAAEDLGRTPCSNELIGGIFIAARFGGWGNATRAAGLPPSQYPPKLKNRKLYKREFLRQSALFQDERKRDAEARAAKRRETSEN